MIVGTAEPVPVSPSRLLLKIKMRSTRQRPALKCLAVCAFAFLFGSLAHAADTQRISPAELSLGGISIGMPESAVVRLLGKPISRRDTGEGFRLEYTGMGVNVSAAVGHADVLEITASGASRCTPARVCPGMPVSALTKAYGPGDVAERESGRFLEFTPDQSTCWLQVRERQGFIDSMRIACQP